MNEARQRVTEPVVAPPPVPVVEVLGVPVTNATREEAAALLESWIQCWDGRSRGAYIVNAHTLNLGIESPAYRDVLRAGDVVFGDGTGVRWAARLQGVRMRDNLVGTDLLPYFFETRLARGYRYYLLGATAETVVRAARHLESTFPGIVIAGTRHGYVRPEEAAAVVRGINATRPDLLLVAMGNPLQEQWIHDHRATLRVPVSIGVGGLFDHWGGNLRRAPRWVRRLGFEWLQILLQQPGRKWRRYLLGNPRFIARAVGSARRGPA